MTGSRDPATIVSGVLLDALSTHQPGPEETVEFFHDDGTCSSANTLGKVRFGDTAMCERLYLILNPESIWGIRAFGVCKDVTDIDFRSGCLKYVQQ